MNRCVFNRAKKIFESEVGSKSFLDNPNSNFDELWPTEQQPYFRRAEREIKDIYDSIS